jgi:hypothetical protein
MGATGGARLIFPSSRPAIGAARGIISGNVTSSGGAPV